MDKAVLMSIVSTVSALAGVMITQFSVLLKEHLNKKYLQRVLFREKYEKLSDLIQQAEEWHHKLLICKTVEEVETYSVYEPQRQAMSLALIYFPEFKSELHQLRLIYADYFSLHAKRVSNKSINKRIEISDIDLMIKLHNLEELIIKFASKYARA